MDHWSRPCGLINPCARNLLDNPVGIQFVHRWFAFVVLGVLMVAWLKSLKLPTGTRGRVAGAMMSCLAVQVILGLMNIFVTTDTNAAFIHLPLAHFLLAMVLFAVLVVWMFDLRYEAADVQLLRWLIDEQPKGVRHDPALELNMADSGPASVVQAVNKPFLPGDSSFATSWC